MNRAGQSGGPHPQPVRTPVAVRALVRFVTLVRSALAAIGATTRWLLLILMGVIVYDVANRAAFDAGSTQLQELQWHLHGALFLLMMGAAYTGGQHIRITVLSEKWSQQARDWIECLGCIFLLLPFAAALCLFGWDYFSISLSYRETSPSATGLPFRYAIKGVMLAGFALVLTAGLAQLTERLLRLTGYGALLPASDPPTGSGSDGDGNDVGSIGSIGGDRPLIQDAGSPDA